MFGSDALDLLQEFKGLGVDGLWARARIEPRHRFDVVVQDDRPGSNDGRERVPVALEVGNEDFHLHMGRAMANGSNATGEYRCSAIRLVIPVDGCNHTVIEIHLRDGLGNPERLQRIQRTGPS